MSFKVFHIVTHFDIGGSETVALNISKAKCPNVEFHMVEVVKGKGAYSKAFIEDLESNGIYYHRSPFSTNFILGALLFPFWFWKLHLKYHPDIYHSHTESPDVALYLFFLLFGFMINKNVKVVRTLHNTKLWKHKHFIGKVIEHFFLRHQANVSISGPVRESYLYDFPFYHKIIPIIYNGIAEKKQFKFEGIRDGKINILFAGRIVEQKGISVLSAVINKLNAHVNTFYFHIVGEGHLKEDLVKELGIFENVHFYGNVYNLAQYLHSFDFLFMPSVHEGLSMLSIESSFAKLPVIINSCEGLVDTVPNAWPLKVKDNNVDDFVEVFNNIRNLDRKVLAESAYQFVSDRFGIEQMQNQYIEYYKR